MPILLEQIEDLKEELYRTEKKMKEQKEDSEILKDLHAKDFKDSEGNLIINK